MERASFVISVLMMVVTGLGMWACVWTYSETKITSLGEALTQAPGQLLTSLGCTSTVAT
jgi:hypothetical protein